MMQGWPLGFSDSGKMAAPVAHQDAKSLNMGAPHAPMIQGALPQDPHMMRHMMGHMPPGIQTQPPPHFVHGHGMQMPVGMPPPMREGGPTPPQGAVMPGRTSRGLCVVCQKEVTSGQERSRLDDGRYSHKACFDMQMQGATSLGPNLIQQPVMSSPHHGAPPNWDGAKPPNMTSSPPTGKSMQDKMSKGICAVCKLAVFGDQERTKLSSGQYVHLKCMNSSPTGMVSPAPAAPPRNAAARASSPHSISPPNFSPPLGGAPPLYSSESPITSPYNTQPHRTDMPFGHGSPPFAVSPSAAANIHGGNYNPISVPGPARNEDAHAFGNAKTVCLVCHTSVITNLAHLKTKDGRVLHYSCVERVEETRPDSPPLPPPDSPPPSSPLPAPPAYSPSQPHDQSHFAHGAQPISSPPQGAQQRGVLPISPKKQFTDSPDQRPPDILIAPVSSSERSFRPTSSAVSSTSTAPNKEMRLASGHSDMSSAAKSDSFKQREESL